MASSPSSRLLMAAVAGTAIVAGAYVAYRVYNSWWGRWLRARAMVEELRATCATPTDLLLKIAEDMRAEMKSGLESIHESKLPMLPSYVDNLPDGSEQGVFYALDLGGTNFRVLRVQLLGNGGGIGKMEYEGASISPELMTGTTEALFDFIASKLASFVATEGPDFMPPAGRKRELGFTFSFPVDQKSINAGTLMRWTKGFKIPETEGRDIVQVLKEAIDRQGVDLNITALVNDSVGTLAGARFVEPDVVMAVILGTGSNACYEEKDDVSCRLSEEDKEAGAKNMVINMEWGNFWSSNLPLTTYDEVLDDKSHNCGEQRLEKVISGMYLGEIVRLAMVDIAEKTHLFGDQIPPKLLEGFSLKTPHISRIHADITPELTGVGIILADVLDIKSSSLALRQLMHDITTIVSVRGARLVAAGILGVLQKLGRAPIAPALDAPADDKLPADKQPECEHYQRTVVAVDGGLYEHYEGYREALHAALKDLLGDELAGHVSMKLSKDGSGIGAALLAASHSLYRN